MLKIKNPAVFANIIALLLIGCSSVLGAGLIAENPRTLEQLEQEAPSRSTEGIAYRVFIANDEEWQDLPAILQLIEDAGGTYLDATWVQSDGDACTGTVGAGCYLVIWRDNSVAGAGKEEDVLKAQ
jgi:hypothetical protein